MVSSLEEEWLALCSAYCPHHVAPWRYSSLDIDQLPRQGWKLHVSATILSAAEIFRAALPVLISESVVFKVTESLETLRFQNCGLFAGYSQIGKFITVYPPDDSTAVHIANRLVGATAGMRGPDVPLEQKVDSRAPVYARYGLFRRGEGDNAQLISPDGQHVEDRRDRNPHWVRSPPGLFPAAVPSQPGVLATRFRVYQCLSQRGKGGVYRAVDAASRDYRQCLLKEGRLHGEVDLDGNDGRRRVENEHLCLQVLRRQGIPVPEVYASFVERGNFYVAMEWIHGIPLSQYAASDDPPLELQDALEACLKVSRLLAAIHAAGWVWRDLKTPNLLICPDGVVRAIDFEGAAMAGSRITSAWGSPGHIPPDVNPHTAEFSHDLYALGSVLRQLLTSQIPIAFESGDWSKGRSDIPQAIVAAVDALLSSHAAGRPSAAAVCGLISDATPPARTVHAAPLEV